MTASYSTASPAFAFDNSFARTLEGFYVPWQGEKVPSPRIVLLNEALADQLDLSLDATDGKLAAIFAGSEKAEGSEPIAQAYAGHQFGGFSPQLGDGRALLLGELLDREGQRFDIQLKGSGRTPFSRGGDGKAVLGPVLREYIMGEAMHALGIPTTRALAAVTTGEEIRRQGLKPGAVLVRVAASHIRVGTFQFFAARGAWDEVSKLADYTIARHYPEVMTAGNRYLALFEAVARRQAELIARWMQIGFVHGVMNTDNMALSGETIDYGPCAFMDRYDAATVFSSIDRNGRYAYSNQPQIGQWNLARFAETLVPLIGAEDEDHAAGLLTDRLTDYMGIYKEAWLAGMGRKIGLAQAKGQDTALIQILLGSLQGENVDFTLFFRRLGESLVSEEGQSALLALFEDPDAIAGWLKDWRIRLAEEALPLHDIAKAMAKVNPVYIPRNHMVEAALQKAEDFADLREVRQLLDVLAHPFDEQKGLEDYARPAPSGFGPFVTYCGT
ncbi:protein adenylyltransferase SelO family protein [uncultured Cohaesibacter sp.]|uniref:protein adenylyltransferase SelO n=1 Tax=uncultured Cohaesibacter sp. TaxID=1002546 RepID=UPI0029C9A029|nr:YdiU family protein [uncultured Cohaesibacter sp.]